MAAPRSLWQVQHRGPRFPRLAGDVGADVVVIGAGVTGCACARALAEAGAAVTVLEAGRAAAGASGRNGGFASAGTGLALGDAAALIGMPAAVALQRATETALDEMLALAEERGDTGAVRRTGSLWLASAAEADAMAAELAELAAAGVDCREAPELIPAPMRPHYPLAAVFPRDCELQPARWVGALAGPPPPPAPRCTSARRHRRSSAGRTVGACAARWAPPPRGRSSWPATAFCPGSCPSSPASSIRCGGRCSPPSGSPLR